MPRCTYARSQHAHRIHHQWNSLVDISRGGEVVRITANVDLVGVLVDSDVVDLHGRRENEMLKIDETEVPGHAQVDDEVLQITRG